MDGINFENVIIALLLIGMVFFVLRTKPKKAKDIDEGNDPDDEYDEIESEKSDME